MPVPRSLRAASNLPSAIVASIVKNESVRAVERGLALSTRIRANRVGRCATRIGNGLVMIPVASVLSKFVHEIRLGENGGGNPDPEAHEKDTGAGKPVRPAGSDNMAHLRGKEEHASVAGGNWGVSLTA